MTSGIISGDQAAVKRIFSLISRPLNDFKDLYYPSFAEWVSCKVHKSTVSNIFFPYLRRWHKLVYCCFCFSSSCKTLLNKMNRLLLIYLNMKQIKIRLLAAHASLKCYTYAFLRRHHDRVPDEFLALLPLFSKSSSVLGKYWIQVLKDYSYIFLGLNLKRKVSLIFEKSVRSFSSILSISSCLLLECKHNVYELFTGGSC